MTEMYKPKMQRRDEVSQPPGNGLIPKTQKRRTERRFYRCMNYAVSRWG